MKKSIAVLGLGQYGMSLAKTMYDLGADVLVVDNNPEIIKEFSDKSTAAICADLSNEDEVLALGLGSMDVVVVAMSEHIEESIIVITIAKELKVPLVVAKSSSKRMSLILKKVGADKVIIPEEDGGIRSARVLLSETVLDYFHLDNSLCMIEMKPLEKWFGKSILELNLRQKYNLNVVALKAGDEEWQLTNPQRLLDESTSLLVVGERKEIDKISRLE